MTAAERDAAILAAAARYREALETERLADDAVGEAGCTRAPGGHWLRPDALDVVLSAATEALEDAERDVLDAAGEEAES